MCRDLSGSAHSGHAMDYFKRFNFLFAAPVFDAGDLEGVGDRARWPALRRRLSPRPLLRHRHGATFARCGDDGSPAGHSAGPLALTTENRTV